MQPQVAQQLPQQEDRERQQDEEQAVLQRAVDLLVVIDRLDERHAERRVGALVEHRRAVHRALEPRVREGAGEVRHLPAGLEAIGRRVTGGREERAAEARIRPAGAELHARGLAGRQESERVAAGQRQIDGERDRGGGIGRERRQAAHATREDGGLGRRLQRHRAIAEQQRRHGERAAQIADLDRRRGTIPVDRHGRRVEPGEIGRRDRALQPHRRAIDDHFVEAAVPDLRRCGRLDRQLLGMDVGVPRHRRVAPFGCRSRAS